MLERNYKWNRSRRSTQGGVIWFIFIFHPPVLSWLLLWNGKCDKYWCLLQEMQPGTCEMQALAYLSHFPLESMDVFVNWPPAKSLSLRKRFARLKPFVQLVSTLSLFRPLVSGFLSFFHCFILSASPSTSYHSLHWIRYQLPPSLLLLFSNVSHRLPSNKLSLLLSP